MPSSFGQWLIVILGLLIGAAGGWTLRGRQTGATRPQGPSIVGDDDPVAELTDDEKAAAAEVATVDTPRPVATVDTTPVPDAVVDEPAPADLDTPPAAASLAATNTPAVPDDSPAHSGPVDAEPATADRAATPAQGRTADPLDGDTADDTARSATGVPVTEPTTASADAEPVAAPAHAEPVAAPAHAEPVTAPAQTDALPATSTDTVAPQPTTTAAEPAATAVEPTTTAVEPSTTAVEPSTTAVEPAATAVEPDVTPEPAADVTSDLTPEPAAVEPATGERGDRSEDAPVAPVIPAPRSAADDEAPVTPASARPSEVDTAASGGSEAESAADDFRRIQGVGPKMAAALQAAGIRTYRQLGELDEPALRETIRAAGLRATASLATWPQQAKVLAGASAEADRVLPAPGTVDV